MRKILITFISLSVLAAGGMSMALMGSSEPSPAPPVAESIVEAVAPAQNELLRQTQTSSDADAANEADKKTLKSPADTERRRSLRRMKDSSIRIETQQKEIRERIERLQAR